MPDEELIQQVVTAGVIQSNPVLGVRIPPPSEDETPPDEKAKAVAPGNPPNPRLRWFLGKGKPAQ